MKEQKTMKKNYIKFELVDNTNFNGYNESCEMKKSWYGMRDEEAISIMSLEDYYYYCREFALAMGYAEKTVEEWFD